MIVVPLVPTQLGNLGQPTAVAMKEVEMTKTRGWWKSQQILDVYDDTELLCIDMKACVQ